jgi:hypothetical protein
MQNTAELKYKLKSNKLFKSTNKWEEKDVDNLIQCCWERL